MFNEMHTVEERDLYEKYRYIMWKGMHQYDKSIQLIKLRQNIRKCKTINNKNSSLTHEKS